LTGQSIGSVGNIRKKKGAGDQQETSPALGRASAI